MKKTPRENIERIGENVDIETTKKLKLQLFCFALSLN